MLIARLLLVAVFAVAGLAKLYDLPGSRRAVGEFGVPARAAAVLGTLLPLAELGVAAGLAVGATAAWAALAALVLLAAFCVAIAWSLARGRAVDCHCFGNLHSSPASWRTVGRNAALAALATAIATGLGVGTAAAIVAMVALLLLAPAAIVYAHRRGEPASAPELGLGVGTAAPSFTLPALSGGRASLDSLRATGRPVLLVFSDPHCGPCQSLAPDVARWQRDHPDQLTIALIEPPDGIPFGAADPHGRANVLIDDAGEVAAAYEAHGTPTAVLVSAEGRIASPVVGGPSRVEDLVADRVTGLARRNRARRGGPLDLCRELIRRELLVRGAGALAATGPLLSRPLAAFAGGGRGEGCGNRCGSEQECINTRCRCLRNAAPDKCGKQCTDFRTDVDNCGGCTQVPPMENPRGGRLRAANHACGPGEACVGGRCQPGDGTICEVADRGNVCCNGDEADLSFQIDNCGACGNVCSEGDSPGCCFGSCVDKSRDPRNCGGCGKRCHDDQVCKNGECEDCRDNQELCVGPDARACYDRKRQGCCRGTVFSKRTKDCCQDEVYDPKRKVCCEGKLHPKDSGIRDCKGRCTETNSDRKNCGECGRTCNGPFDTGECCQGECCDINGSTCCPDGCKNLSLDDENCGSCGNVCGPNEFCRFGACSA